MSRQAAYQRRHAAAGLCHSCSARAPRGAYCARHAMSQARRRTSRSKRCSICGVLGHNRRGHYHFIQYVDPAHRDERRPSSSE